jgi:Galactose oxidase, central domain
VAIKSPRDILKPPSNMTKGKLDIRDLVDNGFLSKGHAEDELIEVIDERELKSKQAELLNLIKSIRLHVNVRDEIVEKPPAGEEYRLILFTVSGKSHLGLFGGYGYEMFSDFWSIQLPEKQKFDIKWQSTKLKFDIFAADSVSIYQSTFSVQDSTNLATIVGGSFKLETALSYMNYNEDIFIVDMTTLKARLVKSPENPGPGFRRFHSANYIGSNLYIIGGLDAKDEPQSDIWKLKICRLNLTSKQHGSMD